MKRQAFIILAICSNTKYILCDEVFDGLDPVMRQAVKSIFATVPDVKNVHQQLAMTLSQFETSTGDFDVLAPLRYKFCCVKRR